jgi:hypothetical protein
VPTNGQHYDNRAQRHWTPARKPSRAGCPICYVRGDELMSRAGTAPLLSHSIEVLSGDAEYTTVRTGEVRFTAPTSGWYGLILTQQTWDLQHVSLGHDNEPHVMIKVA